MEAGVKQVDKLNAALKLFGRCSVENPDRVHPLALAYIGDAVWELWVRLHLLREDTSDVGKMHRQAVSLVQAPAQAELLDRLLPVLSAEEQEIVRRGRNAKSGQPPKGTSVITYRYSTAFEALLGHLFITNQHERIGEILAMLEED